MFMLSFNIAFAAVFSSWSLDGIKLRGSSSCSNGSCKVSTALILDKKVENPVKQEEKATCGSGNCGNTKSGDGFPMPCC